MALALAEEVRPLVKVSWLPQDFPRRHACRLGWNPSWPASGCLNGLLIDKENH